MKKEVKDVGIKKCHIANILTCTRFLAPVDLFVLPLIIPVSVEWRLIIWLLLATTDYFDGKAKRRWGSTDIGKLLDPIADKFMIFSLIIFAFSEGFIEEQIATWIAMGEVLISILFLLTVYLVVKKEKTMYIEAIKRYGELESPWKWMHERILDGAKLAVNAYRAIKKEANKSFGVSWFGKSKLTAYFFGGFFSTLNYWWPNEHFVLWYQALFNAGIFLMFASAVSYCWEIYNWLKRIGN